MAVLTDNKSVNFQDGRVKRYRVADNQEIFEGAMVCINSSGRALPAGAAAGNTFVGVSQDYVKSDAAGNTFVTVLTEGEFEVVSSALTQGDTDSLAYATDDQTVNKTSGSSRPLVGRFTEVISATRARVKIWRNA